MLLSRLISPTGSGIAAARRRIPRTSLTLVLDDEGVPWFEFAGDWELEGPGDAVPEFESFFLDDFPESFARDSC